MNMQIPLGWNVTHSPKPIPDRSHDYDFIHEDYDGDNNLAGTANSIDDAIAQIREIEVSRSNSLLGSPAPDFSMVTVMLNPDGLLSVKVETFRGNRYSHFPHVDLGVSSLGSRKKQPGMLSTSMVEREVIASGKISHLVHPGLDIVASSWCLTKNVEKYTEKCKDAIKQSLIDIVDKSKSQLISLMNQNSNEKNVNSNDKSSVMEVAM